MHWFLSYSRRDGERSLAALERALRDRDVLIPSKRLDDGQHTIFKDAAISAGSFWALLRLVWAKGLTLLIHPASVARALCLKGDVGR